MPLLINSLITQKNTTKSRRGRPLLCLISFLLVLNPFFLFSLISRCAFPFILEFSTLISFISPLAYRLPFFFFHVLSSFLPHLLLYHLFYCFLDFPLFPVIYLSHLLHLLLYFLHHFLPSSPYTSICSPKYLPHLL